MRLSILCTPESSNLIQKILAQQTLATQASVARQALELGLKTLASPNYIPPAPAEPPPGFPPCPDCDTWGGVEHNWHATNCPRLAPPDGCKLAGVTRNGVPIFERAAAERDLAVLEQAHAAKGLTAGTALAAIEALQKPAPTPDPDTQHPEDDRLEHLTPSLSPIDDEPTLASTPEAKASQPPPAAEPEPEADDLNAFLEALS